MCVCVCVCVRGGWEMWSNTLCALHRVCVCKVLDSQQKRRNKLYRTLGISDRCDLSYLDACSLYIVFAVALISCAIKLLKCKHFYINAPITRDWCLIGLSSYTIQERRTRAGKASFNPSSDKIALVAKGVRKSTCLIMDFCMPIIRCHIEQVSWQDISGNIYQSIELLLGFPLAVATLRSNSWMWTVTFGW